LNDLHKALALQVPVKSDIEIITSVSIEKPSGIILAVFGVRTNDLILEYSGAVLTLLSLAAHEGS
jgi:hypothetical protein